MILQATLRKSRALVVKIVPDRIQGINNAEQRIEGAIDVERQDIMLLSVDLGKSHPML